MTGKGKSKQFDEEAFMNKTMHNMIAERDNLMTGMYDYKQTCNVGTDPPEHCV